MQQWEKCVEEGANALIGTSILESQLQMSYAKGNKTRTALTFLKLPQLIQCPVQAMNKLQQLDKPKLPSTPKTS